MHLSTYISSNYFAYRAGISLDTSPKGNKIAMERNYFIQFMFFKNPRWNFKYNKTHLGKKAKDTQRSIYFGFGAFQWGFYNKDL